jgi:hypothetical protein
MKLDDIEKLIAAATPAPWEYIERDGGAINCVDVWRSGRVTVERTQSDPVDRANAAFIAASRELVPRLLKIAQLVKDRLVLVQHRSGLGDEIAQLLDELEQP